MCGPASHDGCSLALGTSPVWPVPASLHEYPVLLISGLISSWKLMRPPMSIPSISGSRLPWVAKTVPTPCPASATHGGVSLQDPLCKIPLSNQSRVPNFQAEDWYLLVRSAAAFRLDIKCRIIVMCLTHPNHLPQLSVHGKIVFRETGLLWCQSLGTAAETIGVSVTVSRLFSVEAGRL